jgi:hypothetical protein
MLEVPAAGPLISASVDEIKSVVPALTLTGTAPQLYFALSSPKGVDT